MEVRGDAPLAGARRHRLHLRVCALLVLTVLFALLYANAAWAETFTVTNTKDSGAGSLRAAIVAANARAGADEVVFADGVSGTITLASTLPTITDPQGLTIDGGGDVTVSGNGAVRVFLVTFGAKLGLRNLTIADGELRGNFGVDGAGIHNSGILTLTNCLLSGNRAVVTDPDTDDDFVSLGGGVYNRGTLKVANSTFSGNEASHGGGIYNEISEGGTLKATNSTFSGNTANGLGGGIFNDGTLEVAKSTFHGNSASYSGGGSGGGISNFGTLKVANSTFSDNTANERGGGILNLGDLGVANSTFSGNSASFRGGGIEFSFTGTATLSNTIVADSPSGGNCFIVDPEFTTSFADGGYNVSDDGTCQFTEAAGSLPGTDPLLDPDGLQDNGGPTETIALQPDSPAVDLVAPEACPPPETDQRGVERPQGDSCDSGAFELEQQAEPKTKAECKKGGYREFGFKNQGQCIASLKKNAESGRRE